MMKADHINDLYKKAITKTLKAPRVSPRGLPCREIIGSVLTLTEPRNALLTLRERKMPYKFLLAEKLCYLSGNSGEQILPIYAKNIAQFINPLTGRFDGAYGPRFAKQLEYILKLLQDDPDTRRAVMNIYNFHDDFHESLDVPCTVALQFLIRDGKFHLVVYMRSNDLLWGTPIDISNFCFLQEVLARCLGLKLGVYQHHVGSLHIYERDLEVFERILTSNEAVDEIQPPFDINSLHDARDMAASILCKILPGDSKFFTWAYNKLYKK